MNISSISKETLNRLADQVMVELNRRWEAGSVETAPHPAKVSGRLLLLGNLPGAELKALQDRYEVIREGAAEWDVLLAAGLSVETMAYVAHGIAATDEAACILQGLLNGRQLFLLEQGLEYIKYRETAPKTVYLLYQNQEKRLRQMGIRFLQHSMDLLDPEKEIFREPYFAPKLSRQRNPEEQEADICRRNPGEQGADTCRRNPGEQEADTCCRKPEETEADLRHLMLLQESELIRARGMGYRIIRLNRKAKITPLALDYLKNHGLTIRRQ